MISIVDSWQVLAGDRRIIDLERQLADAGVDPRSPAVDTLRDLLADLARKLRAAQEEARKSSRRADDAEGDAADAEDERDTARDALGDLLAAIEPLVPEWEAGQDLLTLRDVRSAMRKAEEACS